MSYGSCADLVCKAQQYGGELGLLYKDSNII